MLFILILGCGTLNTARPLPEGKQAVGLTFGGPLIGFADTYIPIPGAVLEGRSGLKPWKGHALDLNYGLNLTTIAFDQIGLHLGASTLLVGQNGASPAISLSTRTFFYNNYLSNGPAESEGIWIAQQLGTTLSWDIKPGLVYLGAEQTFDLKAPSLLLTPFVGIELGKEGVSNGLNNGSAVQLELRHYAIGRVNETTLVEWRALQGTGALGLNIGYSYRFGGSQDSTAAVTHLPINSKR